MSDILEEIRVLKETSVKYSILKNQYDKVTETLNKVISDLESLKKDIDPASTLKRSYSKNSEINYTELVEEFYEKMKSGLTITQELVKMTYPDLLPYQNYLIMTRLKKFSGVKEVRNGRKVKLFMVNGL